MTFRRYLFDAPDAYTDGLKCPGCGSQRLRTTDTRKTNGTIRRKRVCQTCENSFYTMEIPCTYYCERIGNDDQG